MRRRGWIVAGMAGLLVLAAVLAVRAVPGFVRDRAQAWVATNLPGKVLAIGNIGFDVWELRLRFGRIAIADRATPDRPLVVLAGLQLDAAASSLWTLQPRFDRVLVTGPAVHAVLRRDGSLNLAELLPPDDGSPLPRVSIAELEVSEGRLRFTDARGAVAKDKRLLPINLTLRDFSTGPGAAGGYRVTATGDDGEALDWQGRLTVAPLASRGTFRVIGARLATIGRFLGDWLPLRLAGGTLGVAGSYRIALPAAAGDAAPPLDWGIDIARLDLADASARLPDGTGLATAALRLGPIRVLANDGVVEAGALVAQGIAATLPGGERARLGSLSLAASRYDWRRRQLASGTIGIDGVSVTGRGPGAATVALARLAVAPGQVAFGRRHAELGAVTLAGLRLPLQLRGGMVQVPGLWPRRSGGGAGWRGSLAALRLGDAAVQLAVDRPGAAPARFAVAPLDLTLGALASDGHAPLRLALAARIDGRARLRLEGKATAAGDADLAIDLADLSLPRVAALAPPSSVAVRGGALSLRGRVQVARGEPSFVGGLGVRNLAVVERANGDPLVGWSTLAVSGMRASARRLSIARVSVDGLLSHVLVTRELQLNLSRVAGLPPGEDDIELPPESEAPLPGAVAPTTAPAIAASVAEVAAAQTEAQATALAAGTMDGPGKLRVIAPVANTASAAAELLPVSVARVDVRRSNIIFTDQSIDPHFQVRIEDFAGVILGLSNRPGTQARFALRGFVGDRFAEATLAGRANLFAYDKDTDLVARFRNIELPLLNPYSGRFAGYDVARGKLTTEIHWRIVDRRLDAQHHLLVDQLQWGAATGSKDKVPLPIRLASSLLKDRNGLITLDLPVKGTLDDPKFRVWPIVWRIFGNLMGKIALAPFKLLGSIFGGGGGDEVQFVGFAPGSAALSEDSGKVLAKLAAGLADRPEINLDIPAGAAGREDAAVLARTRLEAAVLATKGGKAAADYAALAPDSRRDRLRALFKAKTGKGPKFPDDLPGGDAKLSAQSDWLEAQLLPRFAPDAAALAALGAARADAVKTALLAAGALAPERVFVNTALAVAPAADGGLRMELKIRE